MPLLKEVTFKAKLQKGNRIQIPKLIHHEFQLEPTQTLETNIHIHDSYRTHQTFYAKPTKDGRINIPKLTTQIIQQTNCNQDLTDAILEVTLAPANPMQETLDSREDD